MTKNRINGHENRVTPPARFRHCRLGGMDVWSEAVPTAVSRERVHWAGFIGLVLGFGAGFLIGAVLAIATLAAHSSPGF